MNNNYDESELNNLIDLIIDYRGKTPKKLGADWALEGIPAISAKNIKDGKIVRNDAIRYVSEELFKKWMKDKLEAGDILLTSEAPLGETYFLRKMEKICLSQRLFAIRAKKSVIYPRFLYYYLKSSEGQAELQSRATGATVGGIRQSELIKIKIKYPALATQKKIAFILANYEDLIDNNINRLELLENMAKLIYDEWFIKFKFPGHEKIKMVDSGTDFGEIPKGWEVKRVSDIVDIQKGMSYKSENLVEEGKIAFVNLKCFERGGGFRYNGVKRFEGDFKEKHVVKCGDIVVAVTDMTQNREIVARAARIPKLNENTIIISMDLVRMIPKNGIDKTWLYGLLNYSSFGIKMKEFANGVNVLHLKSEPMAEYQFVMPDNMICEKYSKIVSIIYQEIDNLQLKNLNLVKSRDLLLPKLVSGQIDVSDLNIKVPEVEV